MELERVEGENRVNEIDVEGSEPGRGGDGHNELC